MDFSSFKNIGAIMLICFLAGLCWKKSKLNDKWIPCIVGALGGILGAIALYVMPNFPAKNVLDAIADGIFSGFSAVGVHQVWKQLFSGPDTSLTWDEYQADKGHVTVLNAEDNYNDGN